MTQQISLKHRRSAASDFLDRFLYSARGPYMTESTRRLWDCSSEIDSKLLKGNRKFLDGFYMALEGVVVSHWQRTKVPLEFKKGDSDYTAQAHVYLLKGDEAEVVATHEQLSQRILCL